MATHNIQHLSYPVIHAVICHPLSLKRSILTNLVISPICGYKTPDAVSSFYAITPDNTLSQSPKVVLIPPQTLLTDNLLAMVDQQSFHGSSKVFYGSRCLICGFLQWAMKSAAKTLNHHPIIYPDKTNQPPSYHFSLTDDFLSMLDKHTLGRNFIVCLTISWPTGPVPPLFKGEPYYIYSLKITYWQSSFHVWSIILQPQLQSPQRLQLPCLRVPVVSCVPHCQGSDRRRDQPSCNYIKK